MTQDARPTPAFPTALEAASLATLLIFLLSPIGAWTIRPITLALAVLALVSPQLRATTELWLALGALAALRVVADWPMSDNHGYLLALWCLALAVARMAPNPDAALRLNARGLLGGVFALATLQKLLSPEYLEGTFFHVLFTTDPRFENVARFLGLELEAVLRAGDLFDMRPPPAPGAAAIVPLDFAWPPAYRFAAQAATWWTLGIEAVVAAGFLLPQRATDAWRHWALMTFAVTTYAVAPVEGFGWILLAMGLALTRSEQTLVRRAYVAVFLLLLVYREVPWTEWLVPV